MCVGMLDLKASKYTKNQPALSMNLGSHYPSARICVCEIDDVGTWSDFSQTKIFNKHNDDDEGIILITFIYIVFTD